MVEINPGDDNNDLEEALAVASDATQNGSKNGRAVARRVIDILTPILLRSPDPRIKALAIALGLASRAFLTKKKRRIGKNG